jgi:hypothetical protein
MLFKTGRLSHLLPDIKFLSPIRNYQLVNHTSVEIMVNTFLCQGQLGLTNHCSLYSAKVVNRGTWQGPGNLVICKY